MNLLIEYFYLLQNHRNAWDRGEKPHNIAENIILRKFHRFFLHLMICMVREENYFYLDGRIWETYYIDQMQ